MNENTGTKMTPTMHLRWVEANENEEKGPCAANRSFYSEVGSTGYVLKQWWTDGAGGGEWRTVETAHGLETPPAA